ncbi:MAG: hypothetical protein ACOVSW_06300 [Candidatus Kapaibacteriota bacterium]
MNWIIANIKWIMLISGIITCSMLLSTLSPSAGLLNTFGETLPDAPIMQIVVRNWGALIGLMGGMLIYGAFTPINRSFILTVASISKIIFIALVLFYGSAYWGKAGIAVVFDSLVVLVFATYLFGVGRQRTIA